MAIILLDALMLLSVACTQDPIELGHATYQENSIQGSCDQGALPGNAGIINNEAIVSGIHYNVRTPANYNPTVAHPLLVVFAPAKRSRNSTEQFTGLTLQATAAGFVIVYPDHRRLSESTIVEFGTIPDLVAKRWCIDKACVYLTGHSDGGTVAMGLAFLDQTNNIPTALAPSAAGITGNDLAEYPCPEPISIMVMHSAADTVQGMGSKLPHGGPPVTDATRPLAKKVKTAAGFIQTVLKTQRRGIVRETRRTPNGLGSMSL